MRDRDTRIATRQESGRLCCCCCVCESILVLRLVQRLPQVVCVCASLTHSLTACVTHTRGSDTRLVRLASNKKKVGCGVSLPASRLPSSASSSASSLRIRRSRSRSGEKEDHSRREEEGELIHDNNKSRTLRCLCSF